MRSCDSLVSWPYVLFLKEPRGNKKGVKISNDTFINLLEEKRLCIEEAALEELYLAGFRFTSDNPDLITIGKRFLADTDHPVVQDVLKENICTAYDIFKKLNEKNK